MSFGTGLSGLNAASKNLDVIGHNIANANTTGMKAGRAEFSEMYASSLGAAGGSNGGIGVSVATVSQMFTQGNIKVTGNNMDLAVNGEGFFKVTSTDGSTAYTRNGEFKLDKEGYIITNNGAKLQGYETDSEGKRTSVITTSLQLPTGSVIAPRATGTDPDPLKQGIFLTANLNATTTPQLPSPAVAPLPASQKTFGTALNVYDAVGNAVPLEVYFIKGSTANEWQVEASTDGGTTLLPMGNITFDPTTGMPVANTLTGITIAAAVAPDVVPSADIVIPPLNIGAGTTESPYTLTQYGSKFSVYDLKQDGYSPGELTSVTIGEDGLLSARYSNGTSQAAGQIGLTTFRNPQGLQPINGGYWQATSASGDAVQGAPQEGRLGLIRSGALEESNVDMTAELVNMIVAQRSYQANAQTIKTQDQVLSTLVNLR
jgi:flagellar hook protein FlgE